MSQLHNPTVAAREPHASANLAWLASLAAITLDGYVRHVPGALAPVHLLAQELRVRLDAIDASPTTSPAPTQARLVDPFTTDLLTRSMPQVNPATSAAEVLEAAEPLIERLEGSMEGLSPDDLAQLRDFALRLSIAARTVESARTGWPVDSSIA